MNKIEASEWAEVLKAYLEKAERGEATFADADGIVLDLVEAIGREAEDGGWYADWAAMMGWSDSDEEGQGR